MLTLLSFVIIEMFQAISSGLRLLSNHLTPMVELRCQSYGDHRKFYDRTPSKFVVSTSIESSRFFFPESEHRLRPKPFNSNVNFEVLINFQWKSFTQRSSEDAIKRFTLCNWESPLCDIASLWQWRWISATKKWHYSTCNCYFNMHSFLLEESSMKITWRRQCRA